MERQGWIRRGKRAARIHEFTISGELRIQGWEALECRDEIEGRAE